METIETTAHTGKKRKLDELISAGLPREFKSKGSWHRKGGKAQACRMDRAIQRLFNKKREIVNSGNFKLPHLDTLFTEAPWSIDVLQNMKSELNKTKSQLNDCSLFEWNFHTRQRNNAADVHWRLKQEVQPEFLTQAWYKFYENVSAFPLVSEKAVANSSLRSIHLCEAPGAFVTALNHWLRLNVPNITWNWVATTLNPHYEGNSLSRMINADCFIMHTLENWYFGADNTGNLMSLKNLDGLVRRAGTDVDLVTADGSIDCVDTPAEQELVVSHLHFCETIAALSLLQSGGSFLIKLFTIFEYQTICLVYLLSCCFDKIFINKPVTSKEGNSEVYLVCLGFAGSNLVAPYMETLRSNYESPCKTAMFRRDDIPESFIEQIVQCGEFFKARQCEVIMDNMKTFVGGKKYELQFKDKKMRRMVADEYIVRYNLSALDWEEQKIVGKNKMRLDESNVFDSITIRDSYNSRRDRENLKPEERLDIIVDNLNYIQPPPVENLTFKFDDSRFELRISTGKPYERIESSKFCTATVLKSYKAALAIMNEIRPAGEIPSRECVEEFSKKIPADRKILHFGFTKVNSHELINMVAEAMGKLEKDQSLILLGYSLLSQLSVGVLYLLAHTFETLEILVSETLGCIVTLNNNMKVENVAESLRNIFEASTQAIGRGEAVLSIVSISTLCGKKLKDLWHAHSLIPKV